MEEEAQEIGGADWLDLGAQLVEGIAMDARQQPAVAPLELGGTRRKAPAQDPALRLEREQRDLRLGHVELVLGYRPQHFEAARDDLERVIFDSLEREPGAAL